MSTVVVPLRLIVRAIIFRSFLEWRMENEEWTWIPVVGWWCNNYFMTSLDLGVTSELNPFTQHLDWICPRMLNKLYRPPSWIGAAVFVAIKEKCDVTENIPAAPVPRPENNAVIQDQNEPEESWTGFQSVSYLLAWITAKKKLCSFGQPAAQIAMKSTLLILPRNLNQQKRQNCSSLKKGRVDMLGMKLP